MHSFRSPHSSRRQPLASHHGYGSNGTPSPYTSLAHSFFSFRLPTSLTDISFKSKLESPVAGIVSGRLGIKEKMNILDVPTSWQALSFTCTHHINFITPIWSH